MAVTLNASTSSGLVQSADTSGTIELQSNGTTKLTVASTGAYGQLVRGTAVASTSGTSIDFTSIPNWVKRITVMFNEVSTNGTSNLILRIGVDSIVSSGYNGTVTEASTSNYFSTSFQLRNTTSASLNYSGVISLYLLGSNIYVANGIIGNSATNATAQIAGAITLGGALDRVRITTVGGTDTFDAGSINIMYEG
jgi:hypothetical protein